MVSSSPLERRRRWEQLDIHLELTEGLLHRSTSLSAPKTARCSRLHISSPARLFLPCVSTLHGFLCLSLAARAEGFPYILPAEVAWGCSRFSSCKAQ